MEEYVIRPIHDSDHVWLSQFMEQRWGADRVVGHDTTYVPSRLPGFVAWQDGQPIGVITYQIVRHACEIVTLDSVTERRGIGSALILHIEAIARQIGLERLWLITTNDNIDALRFYQRRGFRIVRLDIGAVDRSRRKKPGIPLVADNGIPISDELELEKRL